MLGLTYTYPGMDIFPFFFNSDNHSKEHRLVLFLILLLKLFCSAYGSGKMLGISRMDINSNLCGQCHVMSCQVNAMNAILLHVQLHMSYRGCI